MAQKQLKRFYFETPKGLLYIVHIIIKMLLKE